MAIARSIPGELALAHNHPHAGTGLLQQGCAFQSRLAGSDYSHVALGESGYIIKRGAVIAERLGQAGELLRYDAKRHVTGGENHASRLKRLTSGEIKRETSRECAGYY